MVNIRLNCIAFGILILSVFCGQKLNAQTAGTNNEENLYKDFKTEFVLEDITSFIKNIKKEKRKDIWLVGGGKMIN